MPLRVRRSRGSRRVAHSSNRERPKEAKPVACAAGASARAASTLVRLCRLLVRLVCFRRGLILLFGRFVLVLRGLLCGLVRLLVVLQFLLLVLLFVLVFLLGMRLRIRGLSTLTRLLRPAVSVSRLLPSRAPCSDKVSLPLSIFCSPCALLSQNGMRLLTPGQKSGRKVPDRWGRFSIMEMIKKKNLGAARPAKSMVCRNLAATPME